MGNPVAVTTGDSTVGNSTVQVQVASAALNQTSLDWEGNVQRCGEAIAGARELGARLICLPELCITSYGCEDAFLSGHVAEQAWRCLVDAVLPCTFGVAVTVGLPLRFEGALYNAVALVVDGKLEGLVCKQHLANDGVHYEPRWFTPWTAGRREWLERDGLRVPLGDWVFSLDGVRLGFEVCEDAWVEDRPAVRLKGRGVGLILNPSASHFAFGKQAFRRELVRESSKALGVPYVYSNLLGNDAGRIIYDGGTLIAQGGEILAEGERFTFRPWSLISAVVEVAVNCSDVVPSEGVASVDFSFLTSLDGAYKRANSGRGAWESGAHVKEEEFSRAVVLGLYDYLRKTRSGGYVVSLSGGVDSSATACLVALMVRLADSYAGRVAFCRSLEFVPGVMQARDRWALVRLLLTTVYQSTEHSSDVTRGAARAVARAIGSHHVELDVQPLVQGYLDMVEQAEGRALGWETDDVTLQNIQARTRGPSAWMLANLRSAILLATSNRSEAAVGYTTMDGDTCGGLSPVGGVDKAFLRTWLKWLEQEGPEGVGAFLGLAEVNAQEPTAELRPSSAHQTDEDDLMPYTVLDVIERAAIRDRMSPQEVLDHLRDNPLEGTDVRLYLGWVQRFFQLWTRNQWKRERYAPSFHLDDENLDPKTWCRFPILSGGFRFELESLS